MASTSTVNPAILTVQGAPEGIVRLFVPAGINVSKGELRLAAQRAAHSIDVGRTPAGKSGTLTAKNGQKITGLIHDFAPVKRTGKPETSAEAPAEGPDPRVAMLEALGLSAEAIAAALSVSAPSAAPSGSTVKAPKSKPAFLGRWDDVTCRTCRDFGKTRPPSEPGGKYRPFRTQRGADTGPTGIVCPQHTAQTA